PSVSRRRSERAYRVPLRAPRDLLEKLSDFVVVGGVPRNDDLDARELVAARAVGLLDPATAQPQPRSARGAGRHRHRDRPLDRGDRDLGAERRLADRDRQIDLDVVAVAAQEPIRPHGDVEVEVAGRAVLARRRTALSRDAEAPAGLYPGRHLHLDLAPGAGRDRAARPEGSLGEGDLQRPQHVRSFARPVADPAEGIAAAPAPARAGLLAEQSREDVTEVVEVARDVDAAAAAAEGA